MTYGASAFDVRNLTGDCKWNLSGPFVKPRRRKTQALIERRKRLTGSNRLVYDLSWIPQTIKERHGRDNEIGSTRTTVVGTDVGLYEWVEEVSWAAFTEFLSRRRRTDFLPR